MVNYNAPLYQNPQEIWDEEKCNKLAKTVAKDGLGTKYPFKGYVGPFSRYEAVRYNGGCVRNGKWYQGENTPLPSIPSNFEIVRVPSWGFRIIKKD